jgi:ribosome maturation factor RimP
MDVSERVRTLVEPLLTEQGFELVDIEHGAGTLRVTVDREDGIDLDAVSVATQLVSNALDAADPLPDRYTLEVSSPGIERPLRTPAHFRGAVGQDVTVKTVAGTEGDRRIDGVLEAADDEGVVVDGRHLQYAEIERARTRFVWGPAPKRGANEARTKTKRKART